MAEFLFSTALALPRAAERVTALQARLLAQAVARRTGPAARRREEVQLELGPRGGFDLGQRERFARQPEGGALCAATHGLARREHDVAALAHLCAQ